MTEDDDILAAEFALGLLDDVEAEVVQVRARTDAALSLRIAWWRDQLAPLAAELATPAPDRVWKRIEARLPVNDNSATLLQRWRAATVASVSVAAALALFMVMRPLPTPVVAPPAAAPMMAALSGEKGVVVAVSYDATSGKLTVAPTVLDRGRGDVELWIIPAGGTPRSLGVIDAQSVQTNAVSAASRSYVQPGATFAITQEVKGGSPSGQPAGPIVAAGKIIRT